MSLIEDNDMIQTISAYGTDNAFDIRILPGRARHRDNLLDTMALDPSSDDLAINSIPIAQQIAWSGIERKCFHQLLCCPLGSRMFGDVKVYNMPAFMAEHDEHIEQSKSGGGNGKEIYCCQILCMITEKYSPGLRRWSFWMRM